MQTIVKLRKCPCCKEWFVTTHETMIVHYQEQHPEKCREAVEIANKIIRDVTAKAIEEMKSFQVSDVAAAVSPSFPPGR